MHQIKNTEKSIADLQQQKTGLEATTFQDPIDRSPEIAKIQAEIDVLKQSNQPVPEEMIHNLEVAKKELQRALEVDAAIKASTTQQLRIEELRSKMAQYSEEFNRIEKFIFLHEQYNKALAEQTEGPVNDMFEYVNFRMFTTLVNGSIVPCCDIMDKELRPFETAMSYGERLRAGIDICKTFQKHYGINAPIWLDNFESLTIPIELDCQHIELVASKDHKQLTQV